MNFKYCKLISKENFTYFTIKIYYFSLGNTNLIIDIPHKKKVTNEFKLWQIVFLHFIAIKRKLLKFFESISHVTFFKTKFFFLRIQVRAKERCIETYDIYQINVSELYELCSNKRSEILLVVRNVCL